jgi:hypothetical protein
MSRNARWFRWITRTNPSAPSRPLPKRYRKSGPQSSNAGQNQNQSGIRDTALGTAGGLLLIGVGGVAYHAFYKAEVLRKIAISFKGGYDPILELDKAAGKRHTVQDHLDPGAEDDEHEDAHLRRREQSLIDDIIAGRESSHYYLLLGRVSRREAFSGLTLRS